MTYKIVAPDGSVKATSSIPYLGYSLPLIRQMEKDGYRLLVDGRKTKLTPVPKKLPAWGR